MKIFDYVVPELVMFSVVDAVTGEVLAVIDYNANPKADVSITTLTSALDLEVVLEEPAPRDVYLITEELKSLGRIGGEVFCLDCCDSTRLQVLDNQCYKFYNNLLSAVDEMKSVFRNNHVFHISQ